MDDFLINALDKLVTGAGQGATLTADECKALMKQYVLRLFLARVEKTPMADNQKELIAGIKKKYESLSSQKHGLSQEEKEQSRLLRMIRNAGTAGLSEAHIKRWYDKKDIRVGVFNRLREPTSGKIKQIVDPLGRSRFYTPETWKEAQHGVLNT